MALRNAFEYSKDGRGIRFSSGTARSGALRYRIVSLTSPAGGEELLEYRPVKENIEIKSHCVLDLTDGQERLLIGPKRTEARFVPNLSPTKGIFRLNPEAPPFHLSRLWLQNNSTGFRFYLGSEQLHSKMKWRIDGGGDRFHFEMDEYCKAYYEGISL